MPNVFHRRPDSMIRVERDDGKVYVDTVENFIADYGQSLPVMDTDEQIYERGVRHCYMTASNVVAGGDVSSDTYGDTVINSIDTLLEKQAIRKSEIDYGTF